MRETVFQKVLSVLLCAVLLVGAVPLDVHAEEFLVDSALVDDVGACLRSLDGAYLHRALAVFAHLGVPALGCVARCFGLGVEHHCECAVDTL